MPPSHESHSHPPRKHPPNTNTNFMEMHASAPFTTTSMIPSTSKHHLSAADTAATSPTDTSDDGYTLVETQNESDNDADQPYDEEDDEEEGESAGEEESEVDEYETTEQQARAIGIHGAAGRRPATLKGVEYDGAGDEDDEVTIDGDAGGDDEDAYSSSSASGKEEEDSDNPEKVDPNVAEEMVKFEVTFRGFSKRFRLINKIGEGTFSSVYKAEDLEYDHYDNSWDINYNDGSSFSEPPSKRRRADPSARRPKYVAVKKIYVTSSPARIQNELELLHDLTGCDSIVPLITAFRYQDQVVAVLPYFKHVDFREYFRTLTVPHMRLYFRSLFKALKHVHEHGIIHRDIKPTNFLYDFRYGRGVLVDFGLAEREGTDSQFCLCQHTPNDRKEYRVPSTLMTPSTGYPKHDSRPSRRANRAGTRGFRAPEVLFKCTNQTTKIDIWSAGVILLTILSRRFPFFNSSDDVDAMIEIATIFGKVKMKQCAALHGCVFETTITTIGERGFTLEKIVLWATNRTATGSSRDNTDDQRLPPDEALAVRLMQRCFELDPTRRISAAEALQHEFLAGGEGEEEL